MENAIKLFAGAAVEIHQGVDSFVRHRTLTDPDD